MQHYTNSVIAFNGDRVANATITVTDLSGNAVTIYQDYAGTTPLTSVRTNNNGEFDFYAPAGRYNISASGTGITGYTISDEFIGIADSSVTPFIQSGTGAVTRNAQDKMRETVSVKDFGATGNGVTDDTTAIQAAINSGAKSIFFPTSGSYIVSSTLTVAANQTLYGELNSTGGGTPCIYAASGMNAPLIKFTNAGKISGLQLVGSATSLLTSQSLIYINNTNNVLVDNVFMSGGYRLIQIDGTSFYITILNSTFYDAIESQLYVNSVTSAGVDLNLDNNKFHALNASALYCAYFSGLGSLIATNQVFTTNLNSGATIYLNSMASAFGGQQWTNCVFENSGTANRPAIYFVGSGAAKWNNSKFVNCIINGANGVAMQFSNCQQATFDACNFSSLNSNGSVYTPASGTMQNVYFTDCNFDGSGAVTPIQCGASVSISANFSGVYWGGSAAFINFSAATAAQITYLNVLGGYLGSNSNPVVIPTTAFISGVVEFGQAWTAYTPTVLSGTGTISTYTATGKFKRIGKTIHVEVNVSITNNGTGATYIDVTLPVGTQTNGEFVGSGRAISLSGKMLQGRFINAANVIRMYNYDGTYPAATGETLVFSGTYENT